MSDEDLISDEPLEGVCYDCGEVKRSVYYPTVVKCAKCAGSRFTFRKQLTMNAPVSGRVHSRQEF